MRGREDDPEVQRVDNLPGLFSAIVQYLPAKSIAGNLGDYPEAVPAWWRRRNLKVVL
ncbi:MAG: hypothetical protein AABN95_00835 [Acidobacteriota bacterium]